MLTKAEQTHAQLNSEIEKMLLAKGWERHGRFILPPDPDTKRLSEGAGLDSIRFKHKPEKPNA